MFIRTLFERFYRLPIRSKLVVLMMAVGTVSIMLVTVASIAGGIFSITQNQKEELRVLATIVGDKNAAALAFGDKALVETNLSILSAHKSIIGACIYDAGRQVYAAYSPKKAFTCPHPAADTVQMQNGTLEVFYTIRKKGERLGKVFIRSGMAEVYAYIQKQMSIAVLVSAGALLLAYVLAMVLQKTVSRPIMALAEATKAVWEGGNTRVQAHHHYEDELGQIAGSFNRILQEREQKHQEFLQRHQEFSTVLEHSKKTLAMLDEEASFPFKAAFTYRKMLETQAFGRIHQSYVDYFNDVYSAEVELYQVLVTALDTFRLHQEILNSAQEPFFVSHVLASALKERLVREVAPRITFHIKTQGCVAYTCHPKPFERMVGTLLSLLLESRKFGHFYRCEMVLEGCGEGALLLVEFMETSVKTHHGNDNYHEMSLEKLVKALKYHEPLWPAEMPLCIDFEDATIRHFLYSLFFLSDINECPVYVRLAAHKVGFVVHIPEAQKGTGQNTNKLTNRAEDAMREAPLNA